MRCPARSAYYTYCIQARNHYLDYNAGYRTATSHQATQTIESRSGKKLCPEKDLGHAVKVHDMSDVCTLRTERLSRAFDGVIS